MKQHAASEGAFLARSGICNSRIIHVVTCDRKVFSWRYIHVSLWGTYKLSAFSYTATMPPSLIFLVVAVLG